MDRNDQRARMSQIGSSTATQPRTDDGLTCRMNDGKSLVLSWVETFARLVGHIRVPQLAVATLAQKAHSQETDGHS